MAHMQHSLGAVFSDPALTETESKEGFLTKAVEDRTQVSECETPPLQTSRILTPELFLRDWEQP